MRSQPKLFAAAPCANQHAAELRDGRAFVQDVADIMREHVKRDAPQRPLLRLERDRRIVCFFSRAAGIAIALCQDFTVHKKISIVALRRRREDR
jgi:hypothetical protein